jgi:hypothetical protein
MHGLNKGFLIPAKVLQLTIFLFSKTSRLAMGPALPLIKQVLGLISPRVKRPGPEDDHSPPPSAEVKNKYSYTSPVALVRLVVCGFDPDRGRWIFKGDKNP